MANMNLELQTIATADVLVQKAIIRLETATARDRWTDDARAERVRVLKEKLDTIVEELDEIASDTALDSVYTDGDDDHDEAMNAADALLFAAYRKAGGSY